MVFKVVSCRLFDYQTTEPLASAAPEIYRSSPDITVCSSQKAINKRSKWALITCERSGRGAGNK